MKLIPYWLRRFWQRVTITIVVIAAIIALIWLVPLGEINQWLSNNETTIKVVASLITFTGGFIITWMGRRRIRFPLSSFEVFDPSKSQEVIKAIFRNDPIAPGVPYQALGRADISNVTEELTRLLRRDRCLIVKGPTGTGKTREIARVARSECAGGWTVIIYKGGWLSEPSEWPNDFPHNRLLVVLDDLHHVCTAKLKPQHPKAENWSG